MPEKLLAYVNTSAPGLENVFKPVPYTVLFSPEHVHKLLHPPSWLWSQEDSLLSFRMASLLNVTVLSLHLLHSVVLSLHLLRPVSWNYQHPLISTKISIVFNNALWHGIFQLFQINSTFSVRTAELFILMECLFSWAELLFHYMEGEVRAVTCFYRNDSPAL